MSSNTHEAISSIPAKISTGSKMLWMVLGTEPTLGSVIGGTVAGLKVGSGVGTEKAI